MTMTASLGMRMNIRPEMRRAPGPVPVDQAKAGGGELAHVKPVGTNMSKAWLDEMSRHRTATLDAAAKLVVFGGATGLQPDVFGSFSQQQRGMASYQAASRLSA